MLQQYFNLLIVWFLVVVALKLISDISASSINSKECNSNNGLKGYSDFESLVNDMRNDALEFDVNEGNEFVYTICPNSILNAIDNTSETVLDVRLNNTLVKCGEDGSSKNNCILHAGNIVLKPDIFVTNVIFRGLTFYGINGDDDNVNVRGYAKPGSYAYFVDCHWKLNTGFSIFDLYYRPRITRDRALISNNHTQISRERNLVGHPAMTISLHDCSFESNIMSQSIIQDRGGNIGIYGTKIISNDVGLFLIGILFGGELHLHYNTTFTRNFSPQFNVFVDSDSLLQINQQTYGVNNTINFCSDGVFIEDKKGSYCHAMKGLCKGSCCIFGDNTCDHYNYSLPKRIPPQVEEAPIKFLVNGINNTKCSTKCIITASCVFTFVLIALGMILCFRRRFTYSEKVISTLGNSPRSEIS